MGVTSKRAGARGLPRRMSSPWRATHIAVWAMTSLMPMASTPMRAPVPLVQSRTASSRSSRLGLTVRSMPQARAWRRRSSDKSASRTSAPAKQKSWAAKLPTRPPPTTSTVSPGWALAERKAEMLTPAMRANTRCWPGASRETGSTMRRASALTMEAWRAKDNTRSPGWTPETASPTCSTWPRLP